MEHVLIYLAGLSAIIGFIAYLALYNWVAIKFFNYKPDNLFELIFIPIIVAIIVPMVLIMPYVIGKEVFGL